MVIRKNDMIIEKRDKMRGGDGIIEIKHLVEKEYLRNARLFAYLKIPASGSIGEHEHLNETEYFIVIKGRGLVNDNGEEKEFSAGDVIITGNDERHGIKNIGKEDLEIIAVIITY